MMPPKTLSAAQLWAEMSAMPRPHRVVPFPRKDATGESIGDVAIWILNQDEQIRSSTAAEKLVRTELPEANQDSSIGYGIAYENAAAVEQLYRACRDPSDLVKPAFPSAGAMRQVMTVDEIATLYSTYLTLRSELGPVASCLTKDEADAWLDKLIEGGSADPLEWASREQLRVLLSCLVARSRSSRTAPSSAGPLPASSDTDRIAADSQDGDAVGGD